MLRAASRKVVQHRRLSIQFWVCQEPIRPVDSTRYGTFHIVTATIPELLQHLSASAFVDRLPLLAILSGARS